MLTLQDPMETSQIQTVLFYELLSFKPSHTQVLNSNPSLHCCWIMEGCWNRKGPEGWGSDEQTRSRFFAFVTYLSLMSFSFVIYKGQGWLCASSHIIFSKDECSLLQPPIVWVSWGASTKLGKLITRNLEAAQPIHPYLTSFVSFLGQPIWKVWVSIILSWVMFHGELIFLFPPAPEPFTDSVFLYICMSRNYSSNFMHGDTYELRKGRKILHSVWLHLVPQGCSALHFESRVEIPLAEVPKPFTTCPFCWYILTLLRWHPSSLRLLRLPPSLRTSSCHCRLPSAPCLSVSDPSSLVSSAPWALLPLSPATLSLSTGWLPISPWLYFQLSWSSPPHPANPIQGHNFCQLSPSSQPLSKFSPLPTVLQLLAAWHWFPSLRRSHSLRVHCWCSPRLQTHQRFSVLMQHHFSSSVSPRFIFSCLLLFAFNPT